MAKHSREAAKAQKQQPGGVPVRLPSAANLDSDTPCSAEIVAAWRDHNPGSLTASGTLSIRRGQSDGRARCELLRQIRGVWLLKETSGPGPVSPPFPELPPLWSLRGHLFRANAVGFWSLFQILLLAGQLFLQLLLRQSQRRCTACGPGQRTHILSLGRRMDRNLVAFTEHSSCFSDKLSGHFTEKLSKDVLSLQDQKSPVLRRVPPDQQEQQLACSRSEVGPELSSEAPASGGLLPAGAQTASGPPCRSSRREISFRPSRCQVVAEKLRAVPRMLVQKHLRVTLLELQNLHGFRSEEAG